MQPQLRSAVAGAYRNGAVLLLVSISVSWPSLAVPPGFEIIDITRDPSVRHGPTAMNNCGQVVYYGRLNSSWASSEIFLYDNGRITRITDNSDRDVWPQIVDTGLITWGRGIGGDGVTQLIILVDGDEVILAEAPFGFFGFGGLNNGGQYAWAEDLEEGCAGANSELFMFDGENEIQITSGEESSHGPELNDLGELVWVEFDFCQNPFGDSVYHYLDGTYTEIGAEVDLAAGPVINNRSQVAYSAKENIDDPEWSIRLWENGVSREVVPPPTTPARMNNLGDITFSRTHPPGGDYKQPWMYHADTGDITPLLEADFSQGGWAVNDYREVLISSGEFRPNSQVRLLRRIRTGDSEFDGDIDHDDLTKLVECMTGPMWVERTDPGPEDSLCQCRFLDINHDGSVDLRDYAMFQENFGG